MSRYAAAMARRPVRAGKAPTTVKRKSAPNVSACPAAGSRIAAYCLSLPGATSDIKWEDMLTFCIGGKIFAGMKCDEPHAVGFKCDDLEFERLTKLEGIIPAPYSARFGWVRVVRDGALPRARLERLIRRSYDLVRSGLPARVQRALPAG